MLLPENSEKCSRKSGTLSQRWFRGKRVVEKVDLQSEGSGELRAASHHQGFLPGRNFQILRTQHEMHISKKVTGCEPPHPSQTCMLSSQDSGHGDFRKPRREEQVQGSPSARKCARGGAGHQEGQPLPRDEGLHSRRTDRGPIPQEDTLRSLRVTETQVHVWSHSHSSHGNWRT